MADRQYDIGNIVPYRLPLLSDGFELESTLLPLALVGHWRIDKNFLSTHT